MKTFFAVATEKGTVATSTEETNIDLQYREKLVSSTHTYTSFHKKEFPIKIKKNGKSSPCKIRCAFRSVDDPKIELYNIR